MSQVAVVTSAVSARDRHVHVPLFMLASRYFKSSCDSIGKQYLTPNHSVLSEVSYMSLLIHDLV
jgi:hypothetical protein